MMCAYAPICRFCVALRLTPIGGIGCEAHNFMQQPLGVGSAAFAGAAGVLGIEQPRCAYPVLAGRRCGRRRLQ